MTSLNKYLILKYVHIYRNIELSKLIRLCKIDVNDTISELKGKKLIKKDCTYISLTKLGKEVYMKEKIRRLIKSGVLKEIDSLAPFICHNCVYYKDKLEYLCEYIKCNSNKIYVLNNK